jgi:hypothetical protein
MTDHVVKRYSAEKLTLLARQLHEEAEAIARMADERWLDAAAPAPTPEDLLRQFDGVQD